MGIIGTVITSLATTNRKNYKMEIANTIKKDKDEIQ